MALAYDDDPLLLQCSDCGAQHRTTPLGLHNTSHPWRCKRCYRRNYERIRSRNGETDLVSRLRKLPPDAPREPRRLPMTRGDCQDIPRPCPYATCRHHLAFEVTQHGRLHENFPGVEIGDMPETCALDVAERGMHTLDQVAELVGGVTRERARQLENSGVRKIERDDDLRELWG